jgi:glycosyltransferase involved in cell wall biosynthesis
VGLRFRGTGFSAQPHPMKIIQITPGSGDSFYCENCLRDAWLVQALRRLGHDAILAPLYLPVRLDLPPADPTRSTPIFFGGLNVYLQQHLPLFRHTPRWLDHALDHPALLKLLAHFAGATRSSDLGALTLSMLRGEDGRQVKELDRLCAWIRTEQPDAIWISNALLSGLARRLRQTVSAPILGFLQDEEPWLDGLPEPYRSEAWETLAQRAADFHRWIAVSRNYADRMTRRLRLEANPPAIVYPGLPLDGFTVPPTRLPSPPVIGYLGRLCRGLGVDLLADAFLLLRQDPGFESIQLHLAGGWTGDDQPLLRELQHRMAQAGAGPAVRFIPVLERTERIAFLESVTLVCVPARAESSFGLFILESLAAGRPVLLPRHGAFPEVLSATGGGRLFDELTPPAIAAALADALRRPDEGAALGAAGQSTLARDFTVDRMARQLLTLTGECRS